MTTVLDPIDLRGPERSPRRGLLTLWVAIAAMLATAVFGLATVSDDAGASEPADAVKRLLQAASDSDVLGALEAVLPSERAILRGPLVDLTREAERLGLLSDSDLGSVDGVDIGFADVHMTTSTIAPGFAAVRVDGGRVTTSLDPRRLPIGPTLRDAGVDLRDAQPESETEDIASSPLELVTVRDDGKWYVSIAYSIAESMRKDMGAPVPSFGKGVPARGEATPQAAVNAVLRAGLALDVERLIGLVSPGEGRALRDYAPLFLEDAKAAAAEGRRGFSATVTKLDLSTAGSGSRARVEVKSFDVAVRIGGETGRFSFDGECMTITAPGERPERSCAGDALKSLPFFDALPSGAGASTLAFTAVRADGAWYVSPTQTFTDLILEATKSVDRESLADFIQQFQGGFEGISEA